MCRFTIINVPNEGIMTFKYQANIQKCIEKTNDLPACEIKYYLLLLINSLKKKQSTLTEEFISELFNFISTLDRITHLKVIDHQTIRTKEVSMLFDTLLNSYERLVNISKTDRLPTKIGYGLLNVGGAILAFVTGIIGGLIGGCAGFFRGIYTLSNPLLALGVGFVTGYMVGSVIGFRLPKKVFKEKLTRQLKFCLDGLQEAINNIPLSSQEVLKGKQNEIKNNILINYFDNNKDNFHKFLKSDVLYDICTLPAQFISKTLEGYMGHHALIKITINNKGPEILEFAPQPSDLSRTHSKTETRIISGKKIIEMMAFHAILQQTHACTAQYVVTKMKSGETDCLSYINKVLTGTSQKASKLGRFQDSDTWVGRNMIGFFIKKLSPFKQDILNEIPVFNQNVPVI